MALTLHHLRIVVAVADRASFTAAAADFFLSQSALSRSVNDTERALGVRLFHRTTRAVHPTPEGEEFVRIARRIVTDYESGLRRFERFVDGTRGTIRIATLPSLAALVLPPLVVRFQAEVPEARIQIEDGLSDAVAAAVREGQVDLAISDDQHVPEGLDVRPLVADRFFCIHPADHAFSGRSSVDWGELVHETFVAFDHQSSIRTLTDRTFATLGVRPADTLEARNIAAITGLVAAGLGVSAVPALVLPLTAFAGLRHVPLSGPTVERSISVLTDADQPRSPIAARFLRLLDAHAAEIVLPDGARWVPTDPER